MRQDEATEVRRRSELDLIAQLNNADEAMRIIIRRSLRRNDDLAEAIIVRLAFAAAIRWHGGEPEQE